MKTVSILPGGHFTQNVGMTLITRVAGALLSVANGAIIARWLGAEGTGMLALALLVPGVLGLLVSGGIGVANVYFAGSRRADVATLTANSLGFAILATILGIGGGGGLVATGWVAEIVPGVPLWLLLLAMLGLPVGLLSGYLSTILQGLQRIAALNIANFTQGVLTLALTLLLVIGFQRGLLGALLASLGSGALTLVMLGAILGREGAVFRPRWDFPIMRSMLAFGLRAHIANVLQFFNYRLDLFIVNYFLEPGWVGVYTVSVALTELLWHLPNAVGFVIFPTAAAARPEVMNAFTPRVFRMTLGLTALGGLAIAILGRPLIQLIYSSAFVGAYVPALVLLPGAVLLGGAKVLTNEIAGRGYPHYNSANSGVALVLTVVLDLLLIPRYGIVGAALASSIVYGATFLMAMSFYAAVSRKQRADVTR